MDDKYNEELAKCASSFEHFCKNYIKVNDPIKGKIPLILYDFQKRYISHIEGNHFNIATKFRQGGFTTVTIAYLLWKFLFENNLSIMVVSDTNRKVEIIGDMFSKMHDLLPKWIQTNFEKNNKRIKQSSNCRILFGIPEATIGCSVDILFIDEAAFIKNMNNHWKSMYPCLNCDSKVIAISNINGNSGWFHDIYQDAKNSKSKFTVFKAEYTEHPDWDEEKINTLQKTLGKVGFQQDIEQKFLSSKTMDEFGMILDHKIDVRCYEKELQKTMDRFGMKMGDGITNNNEPQKLLYECELKGECRDKEPEYIRNKMKFVDNIDLRKGYTFKCRSFTDLAKVFPETKSNIYNEKHPEFNEEFDMSSKNLAELFEGLAKNDDAFKETAEYWKNNYNHTQQKQEEIESKIYGVFSADLLRLAGVIDEREEKEIERTSSTGKIDILRSIIENSSFPKSLKLSFGDYLEVNGVPTLITTNSVKNTYMGLAALWDHDRAVSFVSGILKEKLDILFGF